MSRFWIFSDLHQDWADNAWDPTAHAPAFDVAVVAGDVHSPLTKAIDWLGDRLAGAPVIYVPGNHDFWCGADSADRYTLADQLSRGRDLAARLESLRKHVVVIAERRDDVIESYRRRLRDRVQRLVAGLDATVDPANDGAIEAELVGTDAVSARAAMPAAASARLTALAIDSRPLCSANR